MAMPSTVLLAAFLQGSSPAAHSDGVAASQTRVAWKTTIEAWPYRLDEQARACRVQSGPFNVFLFKDGATRVLFGPSLGGPEPWPFSDLDVAALIIDDVRYDARYVMPRNEIGRPLPAGPTVVNDKGFIELTAPGGVSLPISDFLSVMASATRLSIRLRTDTGLDGPASYSVDLSGLRNALDKCRKAVTY